MKNLWLKFAAVFLWWVGFSMLLTTFANNITVSTDFNTATQYLKKIIVTDVLGNDKVVLDWSSSETARIEWNTNINGNVYAEKFCTLWTDRCVDVDPDILAKFSALELWVNTKTIQLNEHFDYNYLPSWMTCDVSREWAIIYGYDDSNSDDWYLYLCKRVENTPSPHYEWRKVFIDYAGVVNFNQHYSHPNEANNCDEYHEWEVVYAYDVYSYDDWYLFLCRRDHNSENGYSWKQMQ